MSKGERMGRFKEIYVDDLGNTYTDEDLDAMALELENEDYSNFEPISDVSYGSTPVEIKKSIVSFQIPTEMKKIMTAYAKKNNCSLSDYIRTILYEDIIKQNQAL